jgi:ABC-2 type transport system ATP-binding protein
VLEIHGVPATRIGEVAAERRFVLHELIPLRASLEEAYMRLTGDAVEYHARQAAAPAAEDLELIA